MLSKELVVNSDKAIVALFLFAFSSISPSDVMAYYDEDEVEELEDEVDDLKRKINKLEDEINLLRIGM